MWDLSIGSKAVSLPRSICRPLHLRDRTILGFGFSGGVEMRCDSSVRPLRCFSWLLRLHLHGIRPSLKVEVPREATKILSWCTAYYIIKYRKSSKFTELRLEKKSRSQLGSANKHWNSAMVYLFWSSWNRSIDRLPNPRKSSCLFPRRS
jgi:hypothetical protein